jgi:hypothetical protein
MESGRGNRRFAAYNTGCSTGDTVVDINSCEMDSFDRSWYTHILSATLGRWWTHVDNSVVSNDDYVFHR